MNDEPGGIDRRAFLAWTAGVSLTASGVIVGATMFEALTPPARSIDGTTKAGRVSVARLPDLKPGVPLRTDYGDAAIFVVKTPAGKLHVFDAACPHVRCRLVFNEATGEFDCPCHKSSFSLDGVRLGGPAPRDMTNARFEVVNDEIIVSGLGG